MEEHDENLVFKIPRHPPPPPPPTPTRKSSSGNTLPYSIPTLLFHRTLNPRISNKHQDITRAKIKSALELELREERLRDAAGRGDCETIVSLLATTPVPGINRADEKGRTALHFACAGGHSNAVRLLVACEGNVNAEADVAGNRPLHLAVISNKLDCVVALLEAGAKINMDDAFHRTPLSVARSRLSILMNNIFSSSVSLGTSTLTAMPIDLAIENGDNPVFEEREVLRQVIQIMKILRHYLALQSSDTQAGTNDPNTITIDNKLLASPSARTNIEASTQSIEALDSLTAQLSRMAMSEDNNDNMQIVNADAPLVVPDSMVLNQVQDVLENIMKSRP